MPISQTAAIAEPSKKEWSLLPEDIYQVQINDIAEVEDEYKGEKRQVFKFEFVVLEESTFEDKGRTCYTYGRKLWKKVRPFKPIPADNGKDPIMYKIASAVMGRKLTADEGQAWTPAHFNALIGKQLRIGVVLSAPNANGVQYNNIEAFYAKKADLPAFDEAKVKLDHVKGEQPKFLKDVKKEQPVAAPAQPAPQPAPQGQPSHDEVEVGEVGPEEIPF